VPPRDASGDGPPTGRGSSVARGRGGEPTRASTILTIGHGARSIEAFLGILETAEVGRLVDVRTAPGSRKHPQFGRDALAAALADERIAYVWRKDLGGWRRPRSDSPHTALRSASFRGYADYMETDAFRAALDWLVRSSSEAGTAIMCSESLWWNCHRRMIADALTARGVRVEHLLSEGRRDAHRLHPNARVAGDRLVYDVRDPEALPFD
jgi:uncharacterized protein (DUF488 family)